EYVRFRDAAWPEWLSLAWTQRGNLFILTVGEGAMEHFLAERPVGGVPWLETVGQIDNAAWSAGAKGETLARIYVAARAFRERFPDPMRKTMLGRLFQNFDLKTADV